MINVFEMLNARGLRVQEFALPIEGNSSFFHTLIHDQDCKPLAAGFGSSKSESRKIAFSEYLEREAARDLYKHHLTRNEWGLDFMPTACGFAAGFDLKNTILRSLGEACERWVMSQWIDNGMKMDRLDCTKVETNLDPVSKWLNSHFEEVQFYKKRVLVQYGTDWYSFEIGKTIAYRQNGVFPGSCVQNQGSLSWQHALLESFRHLRLAQNNRKITTFPANKIHFFSQNAEVARRQISSAQDPNWKVPRIKLHKFEEFKETGFFLSRTILEGWIPWNRGPIERFLF